MAITKNMFYQWLSNYEFERTFNSNVTRRSWRFWFDPNSAVRELRAFVNSLVEGPLNLVQLAELIAIQAKLKLKFDDLNALLLKINTTTHQITALKKSDSYQKKSPAERCAALAEIKPIAIEDIGRCSRLYFNGGYEAQLVTKLRKYEVDVNANLVEHSVEKLQKTVEVFSLAAHIEVEAQSMLKQPIPVASLIKWYTTLNNKIIVGYSVNDWRNWFNHNLIVRELRALVTSIRPTETELNLQQLGKLIVIHSKLGLDPKSIPELIANMNDIRVVDSIAGEQVEQPLVNPVAAVSRFVDADRKPELEERQAIVADSFQEDGSYVSFSTRNKLVEQTMAIPIQKLSDHLQELNQLKKQQRRNAVSAHFSNPLNLSEPEVGNIEGETERLVPKKFGNFDIEPGSSMTTMLNSWGQWGTRTLQQVVTTANQVGESVSQVAADNFLSLKEIYERSGSEGKKTL